MFEAFLVTTSTEGLQPLGSAAQRSFELVTETIRARLSTQHAQLFAEPIATEHGDMIDWYAPFAGEARPLPDLDDADQQTLRDRLGGLIADIRAEADALAASADRQDQRLSEALRNAIEVPGENMVFAIRDESGALQPVLAHWAWLRDEQQSVRGVLTAMVPRPGLIGAAAGTGNEGRGQTVGRSGFWWWLLLLGWLLLAAMLAFILYLMIAPCGLKGGRVLFCPVTSPAISAIPGERLVIEDEIAALQRELVLLDRSCQPTIPIVPGATEPEKIPDAPKKAAPETPPELPSFPTPETVPLPKQAPADDPGDDAGLQPDDVAQQIVDRGAKRGALNFALSWESTDDIDLSVTCPTGQVITYTNRSACGGTYDLDANVTRAEAVADPVENVVFDDVTEGDYQVRAHLKGSRTAGEKEVTLHVLRQDGRNQTYSGKVSGASPVWSVNISISR